jgi:hypothetical protein
LPVNVSAATVKNVWIATTSGLFYTQTFDTLSPIWVSANGGILPADLPKIIDMQVNKYGQALINVAPTGDGGARLYYAPIGGQASRCASTSLYYLVFPGTPYFYHITCNPYQQNIFYFVIGDTAHTKIYSLDVTTNLAAQTFDFATGTGGPLHHPLQSMGNISYVGDSWIMTTGTGGFNTQYVAQMNVAMTAALYYSASLGDYGGGGSYSMAAAGTSDFQYYPAKQAIMSGRGTVITALPAGTGLRNNSSCSAAGDPTGQVILLENAGGGAAAQRSLNGGAAFGTITLPINFQHSAIQSLDSFNFIWAAGSVASAGNSSVFLTPDQGTTWVDKTGNLRTVAGIDFQPVSCKAVV